MANRGSQLNIIIFRDEPEGLSFQIKNRNLIKYSVFSLKHFPKKKYLADPIFQQKIITPEDQKMH